jgi:phosphatidylinositol alpha-mannosyltransferase
MRIVLTHPFCWPYVRRGTERNVDVLATHLVRSGHDVVTLSMSPGASRVETDSTGTRILRRPISVPCMRLFRIRPEHTFFLSSLQALASLKADVVHSFYPSDALAAECLRRRGHRTVLQLNGAAIPGVSCHRWLPPESAMFRQALKHADGRIACSQFIRRLLTEHYDVDADVIAPPIRIDGFSPGDGPRDGRPTILGVADFDVRRKGVRVLVDAFPLVKRRLPDARLLLSGKMAPALQAELIGRVPAPLLRDVNFLGLGAVGDVVKLYREASVTVLPAMWEPSGTVLFESWASGTPVVAANHGGLPEFVRRDVGVLFDPDSDGEQTRNADGLAEAIVEGVALADRPGVRQACRTHAERYGSAVLGPRIEHLYRSLLG